ncbi:hypothetical protein EGN60_00800 [Mycoplasma struthionis]|uniref:Spermidine/putrescine ABC transporter substrate-binding protein n=1 Tax=Mycoplasma struthionis TaxID=538220 RepID=A0A3G8LGZ7_9MOLU|nr:hypothetical protein EGN60_00800 [Mycoplasma struthionis]
MRKRIWKAILFATAVIIVIGSILAAFLVKINNQYRPSVYNYESYLAPQIISKLKNKYNYKEFKEINEFTQALSQEKAIAGVGSDFQAAQLIIDKKIKKFNFETIYGEKGNSWEYRKQFFNPNIVRHIEDFDAMLLSTIDDLDKKGKIKDFEIERNDQNQPIRFRLKETKEKYATYNDGWDHFYDYIVPYFSQDKGVAYNINKATRPKVDVDNVVPALENKDKKLSWEEIFKTLHNNKYEVFGWTNAYVDNLMIGAFTYGDNWKDIFTKVVNGTRVLNFNEKNYRLAIDSFIKFVKNTTGRDIKNTKYNYLSSDGLELLNHLIEPKEGRSDAAVIYNGDALDAYYSEDNFSSVEEGKVKYIRPKTNYMLMDNWIISKSLSDKEAEEFTKTLAETIYHGTVLTNKIDTLEAKIEKMENLFFSDLKVKINEDEELVSSQKEALQEALEKTSDESKEEIIEAFKEAGVNIDNLNSNNFTQWNLDKFNKFVDLPAQKENYEWLLVLRDNLEGDGILFDEIISNLFTENNISELENFDFVSYTPTDKLTYEFVKKWYFAGDTNAMAIYEQPEADENYEVYSYPIIDNNLRTRIVAYYFEATKS